MNASTSRPVVVGVDGSDEAAAAARYAAWEADRRGVALRLVFAHQPAPLWSPSTLIVDDYVAEQEWVRELLRSATKEIGAHWPDLPVQAAVRVGSAAAALVAESATASLVVVGTRATGGLLGHLAGSVSAQVAAHAHVPVIVTRPTDPEQAGPEPAGPGQAGAGEVGTARTTARPVVVGLDGSEESAGALAFAVEQALARQAELRAVYVWDLVPVNDTGPFVPTAYEPYREHERAERMLAEATAGWAAAYPDLRLRTSAVKAVDVVEALCVAADHAGLLVVGSRGHGGFLNLRLGSTADGLIRHAPAPVAVVRGRFDRPQ